MQVSDFEHFRDILLDRRRNLNEWLATGTTVHQGDRDKVRNLLGQIKDALNRIENESFGQCNICHDEIELHRLEVQPVAQICLDCISAEERAALEEDLYLAGKIHRALLPQAVPAIEGFEVAFGSRAARNIGGDYYDFFQGAGERIFKLVIADAMGHGLPAGLLMSNLQGALRVLSSDISSPAALITKLNKWLCRNLPVTKFVSMVCLNLESNGNNESQLVYTNAGHCLPILIRRDGSTERLNVTGGVLGVHEDFAYEENNMTLYSGDSLALYTDGIIEAMNAKNEFYSEDRLIDFIRARSKRSHKKIVDDLLNSVSDFSGTSAMADDLTAIILRKK